MALPLPEQILPQHLRLLRGLEQLFSEQVLTDVVLCVGKRKFPCHRLILAASSPYFRAMFTSNLLEKTQEEVELFDVDPEALQEILTYLYTAQADISNHNVQSLFTAAAHLELLELADRCATHMATQLCTANCVSVYQFASFHHCTALKSASRAFVVDRFREVSGSEELLALSADDLAQVVGDDNLNIAQEEIVYECVMRWVQHDPAARTRHLGRLFSLVRPTLMSEEYLDIMATNKLLMSDSYCHSLLNVARLHKATSPRTDTAAPDSTAAAMLEPMGMSATKRLGMYNRKMMVFVGGSQEKDNRALTCYDPITHKNYYAIPLHVSFDYKFRIDHHRAAAADDGSGDVYLIGGIFYEEHHFEESGQALREVRLYDPYRKTWEHCAPLTEARCAHAALFCAGRLYVLGGKSFYPQGPPVSSVECYDPEEDAWQQVSSLPVALCHHSAVTHDGRIYVVGGVGADGQPTNVFFSYDSATDTWSEVPERMHTPRAEFGAVVLGDDLYVIGGATADDRKLSTVEIYNFRQGRWKFGEDFPEERKSIVTVAFDDCVYVCGGVRTLISRMHRAPRVVETKDLWRLDPTIGVWVREVKLVQFANVHACVVTEVNTKRLHESEFISR